MLLWVVSQTVLAWYLLLAAQALIVTHSFFFFFFFPSSSFFFFFFIFIPIASPPCPIVPATWHEHSFLDSHSARRRTALQLNAKTPYLCLAACRQDGAVRLRVRVGWRCKGGGGEAKGYRMGWGEYTKGLGGGGCIGEEMLECYTPEVGLGLIVWSCFVSLSDFLICLEKCNMLYQTLSGSQLYFHPSPWCLHSAPNIISGKQ